MKPVVRTCAILFGFWSVASTLHAGSATWDANPTSNDWNVAQNWTPETIPSSETDVATFAVSNLTSVVCAESADGIYANTIVGEIVFQPGASAYTITVTPVLDNEYPSLIAVYGGITNNSGVAQSFVTANSGTTKDSGRLYLAESASVGENIVVINQGGAASGIYGAFTQFWDSASAGAHGSLAMAAL